MREHLEDDRLVNDALTLTTDLVCHVLNLLSDLVEVSELLARNLLWKDSPGLTIVMQMCQSKLKRAASDNTTSSGQEVNTHDRLEDRTLTSRLRAQHCNSRETDVLLETDVSEFIHNVNELP